MGDGGVESPIAIPDQRAGFEQSQLMRLWAGFGRWFVLVDLDAVVDDADFVRGQGDQPEPPFAEPHDDGVAGAFAFVDADSLEVAKDSDFAEARVDHTQTGLVAGEIGLTAGVDQERRPIRLSGAFIAPGFDGNPSGTGVGSGYGPAFPDLGTTAAGMIEQHVIESRNSDGEWVPRSTFSTGRDFWNGNMKDCMNFQLAPFNMTIDELRSHETGICYPLNPPVYKKYDTFLNTTAGRISKGPHLPQGKVAIYNTTFEELGYNPLPEWRELPEGPTATPELLNKYPLLFSDYHTAKTYNAGWLRNVPLLRELEPYPTLHIHPETAEARGIEDGDWVIVESPHGVMKVKAEFFPGIRPDTVMTLHGWWQGCDELGLPGYSILDGGANTNNMYSVDPEKVYDPLITAMSSQTLVQVRKA